MHRLLKGNVSLATVYRFLSSEASSGSLRRFSCGGRTAYSLIALCHAHLACATSGSSAHFIPSPRLVREIARSFPGKVLDVQIEVRGICRHCAEGRSSKGAAGKHDCEVVAL
jgi:Fe2+ or Zn2+ uptake regulation protein